jgi:hypothetical protein
MFGWFRRKPPSDIAQALMGMMDDPSRWTVEPKALRHKDTDLVICVDWELAETGQWPFFAVVGGHAFPLKGRDADAVWKAYRRLRPRAVKHAEAVAAQRVREQLMLPADSAAPLPPPTETLEAVEARVRRLREAVLASGSPIP